MGERVEVLEKAKQPALAYLTAATHGLSEKAEELSEQAANVKLYPKAALLQPANPIMRPVEGEDNNWPRLAMSKGFFDSVGDASGSLFGMQEDDDEDMDEDDA